jgi:hypothetical protein
MVGICLDIFVKASGIRSLKEPWLLQKMGFVDVEIGF